MFFFFFPIEQSFYAGQICEIIANDPRHFTMPKLFPDRIGKRVIIDKVYLNRNHVWCYDDEPIKYRINSRGENVVAHDPRCVTSPYRFDELRPIEKKIIEKPDKPTNWVNGWLNS